MTIKKNKLDKQHSESLAFLESLAGPLTFGSMLLSIRKGEEWTQIEMAKKLKVSDKHLCDIEHERRTVSPARASQWAKKLGYSPVTFVELALQDLLNKDGLNLKVNVKKG